MHRGQMRVRTLVVVFLGCLEVKDPLRRGVGLPPQQEQHGGDRQEAEHQPGAHGRAPEPAPAPRLLQQLPGVVAGGRRPLRLQPDAKGQPLLAAPMAVARPPHDHELATVDASYMPPLLSPRSLRCAMRLSPLARSFLRGGVVKVARRPPRGGGQRWVQVGESFEDFRGGAVGWMDGPKWPAFTGIVEFT